MVLVGVASFHTRLIATNITENKEMGQLLESTSHLWSAKRLVLCISEPYIERKAIAIACKLAIVNYYNI